jgi:ubiquinone/menaquinone biosynthesis C-methylase UbiE
MSRKPWELAVIYRVLFAALFVVTAADAEQAPPASPPRYEEKTDHDPNGTGKFYMGREIALVMGHEAAGWLDRPEREKEEQPDRLVELLKFKPGEVVADVGAGSGYLTFRVAEEVGAAGKVLAVDVQPEMLAIIRKKMAVRDVKNVEPVLGTEADPKLPPASVDTIIMVDVYHELSQPYEMTEAMVKALKPGGRLVFVEYRLEDKTVPIKLVHKMSRAQVNKEMSPFPLKHAKTYETLPWQHVIVFEKTK